MATITRSSPVYRALWSQQCLRQPQLRTLSTSQSSFAQAVQSNPMKNMPKQQSLTSRMKKMKRSEIPSDIGLIPNTYVRPCGSMPSWFSDPMLRVQLEWLYLKQGFVDFMGAVTQNRWYQPKDPISGRTKAKPLGLRERYIVARNLHTELYKSLASGDRNIINKIACSGLANQQLGRLDRARINGDSTETWSVRYRGLVLPSRLLWTFQSLVPSYFKSIHVLADRMVSLPVGPGITVRQVIVRIDSEQTLDRNDGSGPITKNMREYVVIQKQVVEDEAGEWMIWGTVEPTGTENALEIITSGKNESGSMADRIRAMWPGGMS